MSHPIGHYRDNKEGNSRYDEENKEVRHGKGSQESTRTKPGTSPTLTDTLGRSIPPKSAPEKPQKLSMEKVNQEQFMSCPGVVGEASTEKGGSARQGKSNPKGSKGGGKQAEVSIWDRAYQQGFKKGERQT